MRLLFYQLTKSFDSPRHPKYECENSSMNPIIHIALNTAKETIRNRILYSILFFAALLIFLSMSFGDWSVLARFQVMQDFGLATMSIAGLLLSIFIGIGLLGKEISSKTIYNLLSRPVSRAQIIAGKFIGLLAILTLNMVIMGAFFLLMLVVMGSPLKPELLSAVLLVWVEMAVIIAAAMLFSTFTTPTLAAMFTLGFYIAGHFNDMVSVEMLQQNPVLFYIVKILYWILPNLEHFNIRSAVVYGIGIPAGHIGFACLYGLLYCLLYLIIGGTIFAKKDL